MLRSVPYYKMDSIAQSYRILRMDANEWLICGRIGPYAGGVSSFFTHLVDSMGHTLKYVVYPHIPYSISLWDACKSTSGVLLAGQQYYWTEGRNKGLLYFISLDGEYKWSQVLLDSVWTSSTRCLNVRDTLYVVVNETSLVSTRVNHVFKFDTVGNLLTYMRIDEIENMLVSDMEISIDSSEILLAGYQSDIGIANAAIIKLDRGFNVKSSKLYSTGDRGLGRALVQTSDDKYILTGHGADVDRFDNYDNAFVLRINRFNLLAEALYWYTPSGIQADGKVQIMIRAELDGGQLFVSGHGGIVDTSFSDDAWLLALNEDGTCDSASCYPWLVSGIEGLPIEDLDAFKAWYSGGNISITLTETSLLNDDARLVIMNAEGRKLVETTFTEMQQLIPTTGWSSGAYFVIYQNPEGRMIRKVWVP
ncbi:MAG: hypothetical protein GC205_00835 [Bacteroidetes bacterium]|nr:hypothetical protein [Bacteroidota bacterium]